MAVIALLAALSCCLLLVAPPVSRAATGGGGLKVASFNIQVFGVTKFGKTDVVEVLVEIVLRYDIILIQEIRDASQTVIFSFLEEVNKAAPDGVTYAVSVSERLGRTSSREQYAFLYRNSSLSIEKVLQYDDSARDVFEREPYCVLVEGNDLPPFFLVGIHVKPTDAFHEIDNLTLVYEHAAEFFGTTNGIILGDFNADCTYLSLNKYDQLSLVTDDRFTWLINGSVDTTTSTSTDCAYDRMVVAGGVLETVSEESVRVFLFDEEYGLTAEQTGAVSDHYPIEAFLQASKTTPTPSESAAATPTTTKLLGAVLLWIASVLLL